MCQKVMSKIFQHEVGIIEILLMHRDLNNIQGFNKQSALFKDETENDTGELKGSNEKDNPPNNQDNKQYSILKRIKLDLNSQCKKSSKCQMRLKP